MIPLLLLVLACKGPVVDDVAGDLAGPAPAAPTGPVRLQAIVATSGRGADQLVDGDPNTGWRPDGPAMDEGVLFRFEDALPVDGLVVRGCSGAGAARLLTYPNGQAGVAVDVEPGKDARVELTDEQSRHGLRSLYLRVVRADGPVCLAEVAPTSGGRVTLEPPRSVRGAVRASSTREPFDAWQPAWLFDGRMDFGWVEGAAGAGVGERVLVTLEQPVTLSAIELWNGDQRSPEHFAKGGRAARIVFQPDGGEPVTLAIEDVMGAQKLSLPSPVTTSAFTLVVDAAAGDQEDLAISELRLWDAGGPLSVSTTDAEDRRQLLADQIRGTPAADVVDVAWRSVCGYPKREVKWRSNHSFVRYDSAAPWGDGAVVDEVFDGAWALGPETSPWTTFSLFGRRHRTEERWQPYESVASAETVRIGGGDVEVARVADLGQDGFKELVEDWGRGPAKDRVDCLTEELGAWSDAYGALADNGAVVVKGAAMTDLLWRE